MWQILKNIAHVAVEELSSEMRTKHVFSPALGLAGRYVINVSNVQTDLTKAKGYGLYKSSL